MNKGRYPFYTVPRFCIQTRRAVSSKLGRKRGRNPCKTLLVHARRMGCTRRGCFLGHFPKNTCYCDYTRYNASLAAETSCLLESCLITRIFEHPSFFLHLSDIEYRRFLGKYTALESCCAVLKRGFSFHQRMLGTSN